MKRTLIFGAIAAAVGLTFLSSSEPANARGCGGYVNQMIWGCAVWDNNPMRPYHPNCKKAQQQRAPVQAHQPAVRPGYNSGSGLVSQGGGNILTNAGGNRQGGGLVSQGGGNYRPR